jgi:hypothetical protein
VLIVDVMKRTVYYLRASWVCGTSDATGHCFNLRWFFCSWENQIGKARTVPACYHLLERRTWVMEDADRQAKTYTVDPKVMEEIRLMAQRLRAMGYRNSQVMSMVKSCAGEKNLNDLSGQELKKLADFLATQVEFGLKCLHITREIK